MKRFLAISLLFLIGMITTVAASPPGVNYHLPQIGITADMPDDVVAATAAVEQLSFINLPDFVARAGCTKTIGRSYSYLPSSYNLNTSPAEHNRKYHQYWNGLFVSQTNYYMTKVNRKVCGLARSWVLLGDYDLLSTNILAHRFY